MIQLDRAALERIRKSDGAQAAAKRAAEEVADRARAEGIRVGDTNPDGVGIEIDLPIEVVEYKEGASVILAHPAGKAVQAKHGTLTRAASSAGLKVQG